MVDPIASKTALKPVDVTSDKGATNSITTGESKFDKVRANLLEEQARQVQIPQEIKKVSGEQHKVLEADLHKRLRKTGASSVNGVFKVEMKRTRDKVEQLMQRVNSLPRTPAFEPFRQRLTGIDNQFRATSHLIDSMTSASPSDLLKIQVQLYQVTENLELFSKVVEQVTTGTKNILQTQL